MNESLLEDMEVAAREAAGRAGRMLRENLEKQFVISKKGMINLVTEMDLQAEKIIVDHIRRRFPDHQILAEEQGAHEGKVPIKWIIDPLDGTTNYAHGFRFFCVSVAVESDGELQLGVIYDPMTEEWFTAVRGRGARLNGRPIRVSQENGLIDSLLATGFSYDREKTRQNLLLFNRMIFSARAVRRAGSAALDLCYVACGRFEGYWELTLNAWDVAAGKLIVEEAGGRVTRLDGTPASIYGSEFLATNGLIHQEMSRLLTSA